ncbi:protein translocase subunit SecF [Anaerobacillus sp. CMMVII]|uniref:protein translocase subunit SecF n=1 Tax=Anaerobacillus sp. CMMVII TaxID=2755588 RepID=UPI0021B72679|nr:protein translocase subunit SecF [Anaerobacillus sp. CMMVII]MCT8139541.1 protein translocase subunit SecF [Anaerobacillus sp. CMMVII]
MNFNFGDSKLDFVKHRKKFFIFSALLVLTGVILLSTVGLNLGIDFNSGTKIELLSGETLTAEIVNNEFAEIGLTPDNVLLAGDRSEMAYATFIGVLTQDEILKVQRHFNEQFGAEPNISTVTPTIGRELARNAFYSVIFASIGIVIYVTIRFELLYGVAAIVALLHDAFFIITIFSITQMEVNLPFIAAVLTIVGYSINDTIVTFDRIRENLSYEKKVRGFEDLARVVNKSLIQTLARSINTVLTVVFAAAALLIFGGEAIRTFSFALLVGLVAGTYSSLFIAAQLWLVWKSKSLQKKRFKITENEA